MARATSDAPFCTDSDLSYEAIDNLAPVPAVDGFDEFNWLSTAKVSRASKTENGRSLADAEKTSFSGGGQRSLCDFISDLDLDPVVIP
jgi:hypothetical protein